MAAFPYLKISRWFRSSSEQRYLGLVSELGFQRGNLILFLGQRLGAGPPAFKGCGSVLKEGFLPLVEHFRTELMLVAEIRNRHVLDEVFTQDGHFLLLVER